MGSAPWGACWGMRPVGCLLLLLAAARAASGQEGTIEQAQALGDIMGEAMDGLLTTIENFREVVDSAGLGNAQDVQDWVASPDNRVNELFPLVDGLHEIGMITIPPEGANTVDPTLHQNYYSMQIWANLLEDGSMRWTLMEGILPPREVVVDPEMLACVDNEEYVDKAGTGTKCGSSEEPCGRNFTCASWTGNAEACAQTEQLFGVDFSEELMANCRRACGVCQAGPPPPRQWLIHYELDYATGELMFNGEAQEMNWWEITEWGKDLPTGTQWRDSPSVAYAPDTTTDCLNNKTYIDPEGYACSSWDGMDCDTMYWIGWNYTVALRSACPAACGVCDAPPGGGGSPYLWWSVDVVSDVYDNGPFQGRRVMWLAGILLQLSWQKPMRDNFPASDGIAFLSFLIERDGMFVPDDMVWAHNQGDKMMERGCMDQDKLGAYYETDVEDICQVTVSSLGAAANDAYLKLVGTPEPGKVIPLSTSDGDAEAVRIDVRRFNEETFSTGGEGEESYVKVLSLFYIRFTPPSPAPTPAPTDAPTAAADAEVVAVNGESGAGRAALPAAGAVAAAAAAVAAGAL